MPKLIDKTTGNIVAEKPYDEQGINEAKAIVDTFAAANKAFVNAGGWPGGVIPAATSVAYGMANVMAIEKSIANIKPAATGMNEIVDKPTLILAGEAGAEAVNITPLDDPTAEEGGSQSINISFSGNVLTEDFIIDHAIPLISEQIKNGHTLD